MFPFDGRKRKFQSNKNQFNPPNKRYRYEASKHPMIERVQLQKGIRGQLVLFQSGCEVPYTILQNAVDRINGFVNVYSLEKTK